MVVRKVLVTSLFCYLFVADEVAAQEKSPKGPLNNWAHNTRNCHHLLSNSFQCNWAFFDIKEIIEGDVIASDVVTKKEEGIAMAGVTIVKTGREIVRIMYLGNTPLSAGQHIKIAPAKEPTSDVVVPVDRDYFLSEEKKGSKPVCRMNRYDDKVLKTAWGRIVP
jgi:hypothetical protein